MVDKHKEISDKLRSLLRGLDDDRLTKTGKLDTSKIISFTTTQAFLKPTQTLRQINAKVLQKRVMTREEREEESRRLAIAARPQFPDARVMFVEHTLCTSCSHETEGMSHPLVFLRLRRLVGNCFHPTDISYVPEKEYLEFPGGKLPRLVLHHTSKVSSCPKCFINAVHLFSGRDTESPSHNLELAISGSEGQLSSRERMILKSNTERKERFGSDDSPALSKEAQQLFGAGTGSTSYETPSLTPADVKRTIIPIEREEASAKEMLLDVDASPASETA